ncbi:MAG TPA: hypothetical protein VFO40_14955 [Chthoniobacterales bacterium]|nr:hypothetical protein [Chthoniobacterales bacterium]
MRRFLFIAVSALVALVGARAQQTQVASQTPPGTDGLACFENLVTPEYPKGALQGHMDGTVWTWTNVNAQGGIDKVETQVVSAWSHQLHGEAMANPKVTSRNEGSNIMYIESQPATTIEAAAKASNKP